MAVPKFRTSRAKGRARRTHQKLVAPAVMECPHCHETKLPHRVCPHCGFYNGIEVIAAKKTGPSE